MKRKRKLKVISVQLKKRSGIFSTSTWQELRKGTRFWCVKMDYFMTEDQCLARQDIIGAVNCLKDLEKVPREVEKCLRCSQGKVVRLLVERKNKQNQLSDEYLDGIMKKVEGGE